jgi:integrase/recombinase XerD
MGCRRPRDQPRHGTLKRYLVSLGQLRGILDELFVDEITPRTIAQIGRRPGVSNATRRRDITAVSVVLRWCVSQNWREDNPAAVWDRSIIKERRARQSRSADPVGPVYRDARGRMREP